jgi:uncharacterized protein (TIGR03435 family)
MRRVGLLLLACWIVGAQPAFEVASVKPTYSPPGRRVFVFSGPSRIVISGNRVTTRGTLLGFVEAAYNLQAYQVSTENVDRAVFSQVYDMEARAPGDGVPTQAEVRLMLQKLVADRFQLKFHREPKEMAVYALTVDKNGLKMKPGTPDAKPRAEVPAVSAGLTEAKFTNYSISEFARAFESQFDRPVLDKTGLTGGYDFTFEVALHLPQTPGAEEAASDAGLPIIAAMQQQLGLKVTPTKAMVETLVIDHAERASDN